MRHARPEDLDRVEHFLEELRAMPELRERARGSFSEGAKAFLHFHADGSGVYADVRLGDTFDRRRVTTSDEQAAVLDEVRRAVTRP